MRIIAVEPTGKRTVFGHIHYADRPHEWGPIEVPAYPPSAEGLRLRDERVKRRLGLRATSAALGITTLQLSQLERGSAVTDDWDALFAALGNVSP